MSESRSSEEFNEIVIYLFSTVAGDLTQVQFRAGFSVNSLRFYGEFAQRHKLMKYVKILYVYISYLFLYAYFRRSQLR